MNNEIRSNDLKVILKNLNKEEYPESYKILTDSFYVDPSHMIDAPLSIANALFNADATKQMFPKVAEFVERVYLQEIEEKNAAAACNLGALYYTGRIGEQNFTKAVKYYTIAAEGGDRQAAENLGYCYYYGRDVEKDYEKAFHYFALGAFDGHIVSLYKIGDMYKNGYYVRKNEKEAFYIYDHCARIMTDKTAEICGADVYMRLADCFADAVGTDKNLKLALVLYQRAEQMFYDRLENGDYMIKGNFRHCIDRQNEMRKGLSDVLPGYGWTEGK